MERRTTLCGRPVTDDAITFNDGKNLTTVLLLESGDVQIAALADQPTAPAPAPPPELEPGTIVGGCHEIIREIGRGGFGAVYEARHTELDRPEALKVLTTGLGPTSDEQRFKQEARIIAGLNHPNVVTMFDTGFDAASKRHYIAMELLQGRNLGDEIRRAGAMDQGRVCALFADCLDGLAEAHKRGVTHKDLKPANLFVVERAGRERLVVLDFGVARTAGNKLSVGQQLFGTPRYVAPEYLHHGQATPATDVYQMGLILAEAVAGAPVLDLPPHGCLTQHASPHPLPLPDAVLASPLRGVIERAVQKSPARRYGDAAALAAALRMVEPARPTARGLHRVSRWLPLVAIVAGMLAVVAMVAAIAALWGSEPVPVPEAAPTAVIAEPDATGPPPQLPSDQPGETRAAPTDDPDAGAEDSGDEDPGPTHAASPGGATDEPDAQVVPRRTRPRRAGTPRKTPAKQTTKPVRTLEIVP